MMDRRNASIALALAILTASFAAAAQSPGKLYRIGYLANTPTTTPEFAPLWQALIERLRERGWVEGKDFVFEPRYAEGRRERFAPLAADLVQREVDLIIAAGTLGTAAAKQATSTIPIVMFQVGDPVGMGLVASLARPGANITGVGGVGPELHVKMLELLSQVIPKVSRMAVLRNPAMASHAAVLRQEIEPAAAALSIKLETFEYRTAEDFATTFAAMAAAQVPGVLVLGHPLVIVHRSRVAELAAQHRLPAIYVWEEVVQAGGLMSYGSRLIDEFRRLPHFVDRILRGTKPADLPVERPTQFYLVINLKTARALGLSIPPALLEQADRVIE